VAGLSARGLSGIPEVRAGDDLAALILAALDGAAPTAGQVLAIAHTAVSKAEGAVVALAEVAPGDRARELAAGAPPGAPNRDPRAVQVVLDQSAEVLRAERGVLICRTRHGFVCANAGVDLSNASAPDTAILLPRDPDASARRIRARLRELSGADPVVGRRAVGERRRPGRGPVAPARSRPGRADDQVAPAVMITDSFGRAWRHGQSDVAIGLAGMQPLDDWRGRTDASGLELRASWIAVADAAAAAADLARTKDSREPAVIIDGLERFVTAEDGPGAAALVRPLEEDLFR
jgi:coenzyme F420-0:L-glutamate ligase / coenzyme F420-1:gamma-L-glutamate ligase